MMTTLTPRAIVPVLAVWGIATAWPVRLLACTSCVGATDSALLTGMNLGVLTLAGLTLLMLGAFGAFFLRLARRARLTAPVPNVRETQPATGGQAC